MSELMRQILDSTLQTQLLDGKVILTQRNAPIYALCSSICAAIGRQMIYLKSSHDTISVENTAPVEQYAHDAKRVLHLFEIEATVQHLLTSFFLSVYHIFMPDSNKQSILYLREAITISQLLGIHDVKKLSEMAPAEAHRAKKIFYLLLVTERYTCLEANIPVILEPNVPFPVLEDDEFPELLVGFTELINVFSAPEIPFFQEVSGRLAKQREDELAGNDGTLSKSSSMMFLDMLCNQSPDWKKNWILQLQEKLKGTNIDGSHAVTVTQKLNVILSQSWFQSLGWKIASGSYLLGDSDNALGFQFPLEIAKTFLARTKDLPHFAYEANGPGVSLKLLDIADTLSTFISLSPNSELLNTAYDQLSIVFRRAQRYKDNIMLPPELYKKINRLLESRRLSFDLNSLFGFQNQSAFSQIRQVAFPDGRIEEIDSLEAELANVDDITDNGHVNNGDGVNVVVQSHSQSQSPEEQAEQQSLQQQALQQEQRQQHALQQEQQHQQQQEQPGPPQKQQQHHTPPQQLHHQQQQHHTPPQQLNQHHTPPQQQAQQLPQQQQQIPAHEQFEIPIRHPQIHFKQPEPFQIPLHHTLSSSSLHHAISSSSSLQQHNTMISI
ncbi:unnamed protein product [Ambrosiozyma monospora]|uniref:Unnamed protein product n=1 Tax=Ambrosiozyma monospora TaxID=43982 RepID=A0ACB5T8H9_AMBMO|nr:unnamed protein product [Ambrosiozyma monospora]